MRNIFYLLILIFCALPVFADIGDTEEIFYTPSSLNTVTVPGSINKQFFGQDGEEKHYFYVGTLKGEEGKVVFLLGGEKWDVIEGSILIHETKLYLGINDSSYLFRPVELLHRIKATQYRIKMAMARRYNQGKLFDFYKKNIPELTLIVFPADSVSVWHQQKKEKFKALKNNL